MYIRPLTIDDQPFLWKALYHAIHVHHGEAAPPKEIINLPELSRYVVDWKRRPDDLGYTAVDEAMPVGAAWLRCWTGEEKGYGFVDIDTPELSISMLPDHRGKGIGTNLLRTLLLEAEKRYAAISLSVSESNPARRLYEREGFDVIGSPESGSVVMVKRF